MIEIIARTFATVFGWLAHKPKPHDYVLVFHNVETGETHMWIFDDDPLSLQRVIRELGHAAAAGEIDWMDATALSHRALEISKENT